jgi:deoxyribodipyrimidine photo-lyase
MAELITPWTPDRQARAVEMLDAIHARACARERLLAWNDHAQVDADGACVVYWMARTQRGTHNLALDCAVAAARSLDVPLVVAFRLSRGPEHAQLRHVEWMLRGLPEAFDACTARGAHVVLIERGGPTIDELAAAARACLVVADDDVMPGARRGRARVAACVDVPFVTVDADVVVPGSCFPKVEYAARTLRPKLHRVLHQFDDELGSDGRGPSAPAHALPTTLELAGVLVHRRGAGLPGGIDAHLDAARRAGLPDRAGVLANVASGTAAARHRLRTFVDDVLAGYATRRNRPELDATSRISPFIRFGQLAPHEVLRAVRESGAPDADVAAFVEEFVVRRELAYNLVRWNPLAHSLDGAPGWARRTLATHAGDPRPWHYELDALEQGTTHDPLWNAAQHQLVERGHMHGYVRMYWAKQLLLWRPDPADAFRIALELNDVHHLDGRDPNGIAGVAWAIGGTHDRPWGEREVFGQIRSMTLASTGRKFDSRAYIDRWHGDSQTSLLAGP